MTTQIMWTVPAIPVEEAQRRKAYADFDDYLAERERERDAVAKALIEDALS